MKRGKPISNRCPIPSLPLQITQPDPERLLPIARVSAVRIGDIFIIDGSEPQMDSSTFAERDVKEVRGRFSEVLNRKQIELEEAIRLIDKSRDDERASMFREWQSLVSALPLKLFHYLLYCFHTCCESEA